ncbi:MAG: dihydroorotate dehydrogenase [bacterium]
MDISIEIGGIKLETPLIGASGLFGYGNEYGEITDLGVFGAITTKTITFDERQGNPPPRIFDLGFGMLNSIGLQNIGVRKFVEEVLPEISIPCRLFVSIGGSEPDEYGRIVEFLEKADGIDAIEVNVSCPNVKEGGIVFGSSSRLTNEVTSLVRRETKKPLFVKLPPLTIGIEDVASSAVDAGADALVIANTYPAMVIDRSTQRPLLGGTSGGLSGPAIRPMTLNLVWKVSRALSIAIIASGGIETSSDCIEYLLAGAGALQVGSVIMRDIDAPKEMLKGIMNYLSHHDAKKLAEIIGIAKGED